MQGQFSREFCLLYRSLRMDATKYANLARYLRENEYPAGLTKKEKFVLRRFARKFAFDEDSSRLFYLENRQDGAVYKRMVIKEEEKMRIFQECHSSNFAGHAGRDNTIQKIKDRYYWPDYYKDTVAMVSFILNTRWYCVTCQTCCLCTYNRRRNRGICSNSVSCLCSL